MPTSPREAASSSAACTACSTRSRYRDMMRRMPAKASSSTRNPVGCPAAPAWSRAGVLHQRLWRSRDINATGTVVIASRSAAVGGVGHVAERKP